MLVSGFDRYMVHVGAGTEEKFATLTDGEFRAHIVGVLAVAAKSPMRGYLLVGELQAEPVHVATRSGVSPRVAASAMRKLKEVGVLVYDAEYDAWRVHQWEKHNPERKDPTAAKRAKDYRERRKRDASRDANVTAARSSRDVTPPEVKKLEVEEENTESSGGAMSELGWVDAPPLPRLRRIA